VPKTAGVRGGRPVLEDGRVLEVGNVIWCTGFVPDFGWIDLPVLAADSGPVHDRGVVASEPGLYFVGLVFQYALASSLVSGVGRDAAHIAKHIAARHPTSRPTDPVLADPEGQRALGSCVGSHVLSWRGGGVVVAHGLPTPFCRRTPSEHRHAPPSPTTTR
jgi:putative flavoprotein involved in K+ transport